MMKAVIPWIATLLLIAGSIYFLFYQAAQVKRESVGGTRDVHGCLVAGGYAYDEEVGACIRAFDMTDGIKAAAKTAVQSVGRGYALTVVSFNSYEEQGSYDITFERGTERTAVTVFIRNGNVVPGA